MRKTLVGNTLGAAHNINNDNSQPVISSERIITVISSERIITVISSERSETRNPPQVTCRDIVARIRYWHSGSDLPGSRDSHAYRQDRS